MVEAIQHVSHHVRQRMHIVVFGESSPTREVFGVPVQFVGAVQSAKEMATLYPAADIFAFPSRQETFGQTKSEALASGVPVVAFNETACAEGILHKDTGWVAAGGDVKAFAAGIDWAFAVTSDPSMRLRIATQARESVLKNYAPTVIAHQWTALYRKTLESVGRHSS